MAVSADAVDVGRILRKFNYVGQIFRRLPRFRFHPRQGRHGLPAHRPRVLQSLVLNSG